ncbi:MAG: molecular chaperone DnaJ [Rhodospirillaceae bacterium]|nr:molecular chaperone DnaJ [Rhodospirillaceae bacterium]|tara:strand:- start:837 stop:1484 length:648 start_codon:yes stop_codon:yes gene_type:complete
MAAGKESNRKRSYAIPCASAFRDAVTALAERRRVNAGDLARSVLLLVPRDVVARYPDPGEPAPDDREQVVLKSGPSANKPWRRKPRLQVRLPDGFKIPEIRRALGMALAMEEGGVALTLEEGRKPKLGDRLKKAEGEVDRLKGAVMALAFEPLDNGIRTRADALYVMGFPPNARPDQKAIRARFRMLTTIHHPDSGFGHHERMTQLNEALSTLKS